MTKHWDVIVIGGGPAGMMAAGTAAARGQRVLLLEKNEGLGKKLLITGGGRCNVTNNKPNIRTMISSYKGAEKFLPAAFSQFAVDDTISFFLYRGVPFKEEDEGRLFPQSNKAESIWNVMVSYIKENGVEVKTNAAVNRILRNSDKTFSIELNDKQIYNSTKCIVATGGTSRPETGSTGEGFEWLKLLGHKIIANDFSLVPISIKEEWVKSLSGMSLADIKINVVQNGKRKISKVGKILFTHFGVSGPTILNMSKSIGELLQEDRVTIELDLYPNLDIAEVRKKLQDILTTESNKALKNVLSKMITKALIPAFLEISEIDGDTFNHSLKREHRLRLADLMKALPMTALGLLGSDKAIVSSGGVDIAEVNFSTMESKVVSNLYLVGDVLNIDRPSGGYSLQLCWTTGYVAGSSC